MTFTTRLGFFLAIAIAGIIAWQWNVAADSSRETAQLAIRQFQNSDAVAAELQQTSLAQNWWPCIWPAIIIVVAIVMFWDDAERWFKSHTV